MPGKPNVLLITTDQQRFDTTGPESPAFVRTPHMDFLRREGIFFSRAYSDCPMCVPSRVSMMTGKLALNHGMNRNGRSTDAMGREGTLAGLMRAEGYQTAAIGKMHFCPERARHGFDEMIIPADYYAAMKSMGQDICQPMRHGLGQNELYPGMATVPEAMTLTNWTAQQCVEYIRTRRDPMSPFFLWCSFSKPHPPFDPPEPYYSMYGSSYIPAPVYGDWSEPGKRPHAFERMIQMNSYDLIPPEVIRAARAAYLGLITQVDYNIGRVIAAMQDIELLDDTLIIFTSDHGEYLGDHHGGSKVFFHEVSARVPFIVRLPRSWENRMHGSTCESLVTHADVMTTILTAVGVKIPSDVDGVDLVSLARGGVEPRKNLVASAYYPGGDWAHIGITDGRWKYMWYPEGPVRQLFDLRSDPRELTNLADRPEYATQVERLTRELLEDKYVAACPWVKDGQLVSTPPKNDSPQDRRNRSGLGMHTENYHHDVRH